MRIKALFVFLFASASLWAQESLISDRPGQTYSSQVLNQWRVQYQQGFEWRDFYTRPLDGTILVEQRRLTADAAFRLGLGQNLEAGLAYSYTGINNPIFDDEYRGESANPRVVLRAGLPGSSERFSWAFIVQSSFSDLDYRLSASLNDGPWGVSGNLGFAHSEDVEYTAQWTVLLSYSLDKYSVFAEVYGLSLNSANSDYLAFDAGFNFIITPKFAWDVYVGNQIGTGPAVGLFSNYFVNTGFSWRIR